MTPPLRSMVATTYVADIDASRAFYELLGFHEHSAGKAAASAWLALNNNGYRLLLASTTPPLATARLPLLFYFFYADLGAVVARLTAAGVPAVHLGSHPPHAPGGEVKVLDPDGNTVLLGQPERAPSQPATAEDALPRFSLLKEAAELVQAKGGTTAPCRVSDIHGAPCTKPAEVKIADSQGDTVWACLAHADDILVTVPSAFLASQDGPGIAEFLRYRGAGAAGPAGSQ